MKTLTTLFKSAFFCVLCMLTFNQNTAYSNLFWNQSLSLTGSATRYVAVPNSSTLNLTGSFTLEAWVNPSNISTKGVLSKGGALGTALRYGIRITSSRVVLITGGAGRLSSKTTSLIPINKWTHISASYNSSTNEFKIYINGILDTSSVVAAAAPPSNSDSLFIGISGNTTPFNGLLDEVRIWNRELSSTEVGNYFRTSLGTSSGIYNGLVFSMTFQKQSNTSPFSVNDFSGNGNNGNAINVLTKSHSFNPSHTISQNECVEFDGTDDYLAANDTSTIDPVNELTVECWVYPRKEDLSRVISKKFGVSYSYALNVASSSSQALINGLSFASGAPVPLYKWTHVAFTYNATEGRIRLYHNGILTAAYNTSNASINTNSDSLYIGSVPASPFDFDGYVDEVRISNREKSNHEISEYVYKSLENSNDPDISSTDICYNLDGYCLDNAENGGPVLYFRNNARYSHSSAIANQPRSPLLRDNSVNFYEGFYNMTQENLRIPSAGTSGSTASSRQVNMDKVITDLNCFVAINHTNSSNLKIYLTRSVDTDNSGISEDSLLIFDGHISKTTDNHVVLLFDDQADSSLIDNVYASFCSKIKPLNSINAEYAGKNTLARWGIKITDNAAGDTGLLYTYGFNFNNMSKRETSLNTTAFVQGFYNAASNSTIRDTMRVYMRNSASPYLIVDSSKNYFDVTGLGLYSFDNISLNSGYYIQLKHRNSIETWSSVPIEFTSQNLSYDFHVLIANAYGSNQTVIDFSPTLFGIYNGDVSQDGVIDGTDTQLIDNDAANFESGYLVTDINGDEIIDGSDALIAGNNSDNFVTAVTP